MTCEQFVRVLGWYNDSRVFNQVDETDKKILREMFNELDEDSKTEVINQRKFLLTFLFNC